MEITGKCVVLTGAASGIGRAVLAELAAYEVQIVAVDQDEAGLTETIAALAGKPATITPYVCDVADPANIDALFEQAIATLGRIDLFLANAGFAYYESLTHPDWDRLDTIYRVNVYAPIYSAVKMRALYGEQPYKVVITASAIGLLAIPGYAVYASTKAALHRFAEAYRLELDDPARLALVYPIGTRTNFFRRATLHGAPHTWPTQSAPVVARAIIHGIEQDRLAIIPSRLFRVVLLLDRVLPLVRHIEQKIEHWRFKRWLAKQPPTT